MSSGFLNQVSLEQHVPGVELLAWDADWTFTIRITVCSPLGEQPAALSHFLQRLQGRLQPAGLSVPTSPANPAGSPTGPIQIVLQVALHLGALPCDVGDRFCVDTKMFQGIWLSIFQGKLLGCRAGLYMGPAAATSLYFPTWLHQSHDVENLPNDWDLTWPFYL